MLEYFAIGIREIHAGLKRHSVWLALATEDIGDQHRRTTLGPLWLMANYLLLAGTFIAIFRRGEGIEDYPAYVATGLFVWLLIAEVFNKSVSLFAREEGFIKGTTLPLFVYVMRLTTQVGIRACYIGIGWLGLMLVAGYVPELDWLNALVGALLIALTIPAAVTVNAILGAFFPDLQFIVSNLMRIGMFLTPIFWTPEDRGGMRAILYNYNPFSHYLALVREPILSGKLPVQELLFCSALSAACALLAVLLLGAFRKRIVFVL